MTDYLAQSWEDCARHVEAGGVVEVQDAPGAWTRDTSGGRPVEAWHYRGWDGLPGDGFYLPRRLLPIPVTSWEQCAAHVEAGGVVETEQKGTWRPVGRVSTYRERLGSPTDPMWLPHRLVPIISAAPTPDESSTDTGEGQAQAATGEGHDSAGECSGSPATMTGAERYLADRMADPEYAAAYAATTLPEVPDGHEIVVLPSEATDFGASLGEAEYFRSAPRTELVNACREAVRRRPKPAPETEWIPWFEVVGRKTPDGTPIVSVRMTAGFGVEVFLSGDIRLVGGTTTDESTVKVEVLVDGES